MRTDKNLWHSLKFRNGVKNLRFFAFHSLVSRFTFTGNQIRNID
jgi:hypothetical protein